MRKFFEGLSLTGGALIVSSVLFGIFLRVYQLDLISHWSDELATIYYSKNLNLVFFEETHPPGFYLFTKIIVDIFGDSVLALRTTVSFLSVILCLYLLYFSKRIFSLNGWIVFNVLLFLAPVDIAYSRIARMYSPLFTMSLWFYLCVLDGPRSYKKLFGISLVLSWIFPLGFLPGFSLLITNFFQKKRWNKENFYLGFSIFPIILYYCFRWVMQPKEQFISGYLREGNKVRSLLEDFLFTLAGDHIPKLMFLRHPSSVWLVFGAIMLLICLGSLFFAKKEDCLTERWGLHAILIVVSVTFVKVFSIFVINIELGRYLIFLVPLLIIHSAYLGDSIKEKNYHTLALVFYFLLLVHHVFFYRPFEYYVWERETFRKFGLVRQSIPGGSYVFCGNKYQYDFYFKTPHKHCMQEYEKLRKEGKDFAFVDMNGFMQHSLFEISKEYDVQDISSLGSGTIARAYYRQKKSD